MDNKWEFDKFYEDSYELAKNAEIKKFTTFLETNNKELTNLEDAFSEVPYIHWDFDSNRIDLDIIPYEQASLIELVRTDNKILNKIVIVFSALCSEIDYLVKEAESKYFNGLLYYGEASAGSSETGDAQKQMGRFLSLLQELYCFVKRCYQVIKSTIHQLSIIFSQQKASFKIDSSEMHFEMVFTHIGSLLRVLTTFDSIIAQQPHLKDDWNVYKRMVKSVHHNTAKFSSIDMNKFHRFEKQLIELEGQLLDGTIYQHCVEQIFDEKTNYVSKNVGFMEEFSFYMKQTFDSIEPVLNDYADIKTFHKWVGLCGLYVLFYQIFRNFDKKLFKSIWDTYKKVPAIHLTGSVVWYSNDFLLAKLPSIAKTIDKKADQTCQTIRVNYIQQRIQNLSRETQQFYLNVAIWMSKMDALNDWNIEKLFKNADLLFQGVRYANEITNLYTVLTNMSASLSKVMTKASVLSLCHLVELLKAIQMTYHKKKEFLLFNVQLILQKLGTDLLNFIQAARKRLMADKKYNEKRLDILSGLVLAANALNGPMTRERILIARFGLAIGNRMKTFRDEENVVEILNRIEKFATLNSKIKSVCDCRFIYWQQTVFLPIYLDDLYENVNSPNKIHYFIWALRDCIEPLKHARHENPDILIERYLNDLIRTLKENFLDKLCREIENDLRLSIHLHLQLNERKPFKDGIKDLSKFVHIMPIRIYDRTIRIKEYVEEYLDKTFYNLTTVALYDWRTYSEMRNLAEQKYRLSLLDPNLPTQTLEQGSDVLEIMRTINVFVTKYLYNLNNQIFVERSSNNKHLNTINIRHIANSIRTHGIGIMNTTINYTYQYLRKQFFIFSQFLFDEHIKAKLIRDISFYRENKMQLNQKYPYERAEKFNRSIRKLGILEDNQTYLDQFRILISSIGNAMGYIRMIRSGGLRCCSNAIRFVPDLEDIVTFEQYAAEANLSEQTTIAAKNLDTNLINLVKNFTEGTEYFKILVDVFAPEFRNDKNMHLRNFYIILPALTLNFIEHIISCKEKINKKNNIGALFTDDGFAMGVAYILKLLNQYNDFDSLHWFESVREKFQMNKSTIIDQQKATQTDDKLAQTQVLTLQRYTTYLREFELLQYSLSSARIFFRADAAIDEATASAAAAAASSSNASADNTTTNGESRA